MPHMMPMLWMLIFFLSLLFLFLLSTLIYFFYLPNLTRKNIKPNLKSHKWNWMW
uniref:ATP synthase F0 subunit 8 n=1 Tax=Camponotus japonicus TaxID=84547 RepID=UPI001EF9D616|nr:ATP synthase F0 subunit 8 [Camponotus japonicus]UHM24983.1 ATP synthase F0 subunit 8 [Camponotus japonicus]